MGEHPQHELDDTRRLARGYRHELHHMAAPSAWSAGLPPQRHSDTTEDSASANRTRAFLTPARSASGIRPITREAWAFRAAFSSSKRAFPASVKATSNMRASSQHLRRATSPSRSSPSTARDTQLFSSPSRALNTAWGVEPSEPM